MWRSVWCWWAVRARSVLSEVVLAILVACALGALSASEALASTIGNAYPASGGYYSANGFMGSTALGVCKLYAADLQRQIGKRYEATGTTQPPGRAGNCIMDRYSLDGTYYDTITVYGYAFSAGCAAGDTLKADGYCYPPGAPPPPPDCTKDSVKGAYVGASVQGSGSLPAAACIQGCSYPIVGVGVEVGGQYAGGLGVGTGGACSAANYDKIDTTTKPTDPPSLVSCAQRGLVYGTFNGVGMCQKGGDVPGSSVKTDTKSSTTTTDASGVQASPQVTNVTTTVTTNNNGVTTVTQTTTNPDGTKSSTTTDKDTFCSKSPNDALCKSLSAASGGDACDAAPVCQGDAIQCAMLAQQWRTRCEPLKKDAVVDLGQQLASGQDPLAATLPSPGKATQVDMSQQFQNIDDMGIPAQCLPDLHIPLGALPGSTGATLDISTAPLCDFGKLFGVLNVIATTALCAWMLRGAI